MRNIVIVLFIIFSISCVTYNKSEPEIVILEENNYEELVTVNTQKVYDSTVLKGMDYPTIINDTPFTNTELDILRNSEGLELEATVDVAHYFKYFLRDRRELLEVWIKNSRPYILFIRNEFESSGVPTELIYLPFLESGFNPMAYSRAGAGGIWQFMPNTAKSYGMSVNWWIDERREVRIATPNAIKHLKHLYGRFNDWYITLAAYNAGEGRLSNAIKKSGKENYFDLNKTKHIPKETRKYVPQYLAIVKIMKNLEKLGFEDFSWDIDKEYKSIVIKGGRDLYKLSGEIGLTWKQFKEINPSYRRYVNNPSHSSVIYIPADLYEKAVNHLKIEKPITENGYQYYTVQKGDTWWKLSDITGKNITSIKRLNGLSSNYLKTGQRVMLPQIIKKEKPKVLLASASFEYNYHYHTVKSGDTLSGISIGYNIKLSTIYKLNDMNPYSILKVGQKVKLPYISGNESLKSYHQVIYGDTLSGISYKYDISLKRLMALNSISDPGSIKVGDKIKLY